MNIRTIFDLERCVKNAVLRQRLLRTLLDDEETPGSAYQQPPSRPAAKGSEIALNDADELQAIICYIRDDLHVRRLRQIWDVINGRLDDRYSRHALESKVEPGLKAETKVEKIEKAVAGPVALPKAS